MFPSHPLWKLFEQKSDYNKKQKEYLLKRFFFLFEAPSYDRYSLLIEYSILPAIRLKISLNKFVTSDLVVTPSTMKCVEGCCGSKFLSNQIKQRFNNMGRNFIPEFPLCMIEIVL